MEIDVTDMDIINKNDYFNGIDMHFNINNKCTMHVMNIQKGKIIKTILFTLLCSIVILFGVYFNYL